MCSWDGGKCLAIKPEILEELQTLGNATMDASSPPERTCRMHMYMLHVVVVVVVVVVRSEMCSAASIALSCCPVGCVL